MEEILNTQGEYVKPKTSYFYTELMVTAGPRKDFKNDANEGDFDLGEDVAGCFVIKDRAFFWLLDGTSDCPVRKDSFGKEYFSSRLLAQELGWHIQESIWKSGPLNTFDSRAILENAFHNIRDHWEKRVKELSEDDKERLLQLITEKTKLIVSTTVILGMLTLNGELQVSQIGDSVIVVNPDNLFPENKGRFFMIMEKDENREIIFTYNPFEDTRCQTESPQNIESIILASDGISKNTIAWLKMRKPDFRDPAFRKTIAAIRQKTCDDKAICIIQILTDDESNDTRQND